MRTLLYVPIIHTSADLGSLAKDVHKKGVSSLGKEFWEEHIRTVDGFWDAIAHYFDIIDVSGAKLYQDGMIAGSEIGEMIVAEGIKLGSKNYELISGLIKRGAVLMKTEDLTLVKEEHSNLIAITQARSITRKLIAFIKYKLVKNRLLEKRDKFIAKVIDETLNPGEKGILFIGAYHNVKQKLPSDIHIIEVKDIEKVRSYQTMLPYYNKHKKQLDESSSYLVKVESDE